MNNTVVVKGKLIKAREEVKEFKGRKTPTKFYITLAEVEKTDAIATMASAFANSGEKFTPSWIKEFDGFVNLSTKYDLPTMDTNNQRYPSLQTLINDGFAFMGADVTMVVDVKDGALYPKAIKFDSDGAEYDPFSAMFD